MNESANSASAPEGRFRLWPALVEAVRGSQQNYTTGPPDGLRTELVLMLYILS